MDKNNITRLAELTHNSGEFFDRLKFYKSKDNSLFDIYKNDRELALWVFNESVKPPENRGVEGTSIYGYIGGDTMEEMKTLLESSEGDIRIDINSGGGSYFAGVGIYRMLKDYDKGQVTTRVEGLAASAANLIFMAGDNREVYNSSVLLAHKAMTIVWGNSNDVRKELAELETLDRGIVKLYCECTGANEGSVGALLDEDRYMDADEAIEKGFANVLLRETKEEDGEDAENNLAIREEIKRERIAALKIAVQQNHGG